MTDPISLERDGDVAVIVADNPPVNALSAAVRDGLVRAVDKVAASDARAAVLRCDGRTFFSGADIAELDRPLEGADLLALEAACGAAPQPIVAAMHGHVLGGGIVVGYCADYRIAAAGTCFGMPEVKLGLLATFGGTQLLPRLIGIANTIELLIGAEPIDATRAAEIGFIDEVVAPEMLHDAALHAARRLTAKRRVRTLGWSMSDRAEGGALIDAAEADVAARCPGWEAPLATLAAMRTGWRDGLEAGLAEEARLFDLLKCSRQSAVLRRLFFAGRMLARTPLDAVLANRLIDVAGVYDPERDAAQRAALAALDPAPLGGPALADAAIVAVLGWPIWKADVFFDHDS